MATDWSLPDIDLSNYVDILSQLKARDDDAATLFYTLPSNPPVNSIAYDRATNLFKQYNGMVWANLILSIAGGGTGASTAANARTNLGLGSLATQDANAVNITGGGITATLAGLGASITDLNASNIASGTLDAARLPANLGAIKQVKVGTYSTEIACSSNATPVTTSLSITMTMINSSNKLILIAFMPTQITISAGIGNTNAVRFYIYKDSVEGTFWEGGSGVNLSAGTADVFAFPATIFWAPYSGDSGSHTYTVYFKPLSNMEVKVHVGNTPSTFLLIEYEE